MKNKGKCHPLAPSEGSSGNELKVGVGEISKYIIYTPVRKTLWDIFLKDFI